MAGPAALLLGDIIGISGITALKQRLPGLKKDLGVDIVVANGENAAGGFGLSPETAIDIFASGVDVITSGNHIWQKRDLWPVLERDERILRPANYPPGAPGHGLWRGDRGGKSFVVINLQGREHMYPIDCPFRTADALLSALEGDPIIIVDFHAESTEEKEALGLYLDGRVACLVGTHTHVQTADERILPKGCAYLTDLGMVGPDDSVIGMKTDICVKRSLSQMPLKMEVEEGPARVCGLFVRFDTAMRKALAVERVNMAAE